MARILILYGTTEGQTKKIADVIGARVTSQGMAADVIEAGTGDPQPEHYDGIIVAASLHGGQYQKPVRQWLARHAGRFGNKATAFVSVSLGCLQNDPKVAADIAATIERLTTAVGWRPGMVKRVAGALLYTQYNFFIRWFMKRIAAKAGGDTDTSRDYEYTDWNDVRDFADQFVRNAVAPRGHAA
jgi:menaquinone-dependent protoporphyrinogen oxidase